MTSMPDLESQKRQSTFTMLFGAMPMEHAVFRRFTDHIKRAVPWESLFRNLQTITIKVVLETLERASQRPEHRERKTDALSKVRRRDPRRFIAALLEACGVELPASWRVLGAACNWNNLLNLVFQRGPAYNIDRRCHRSSGGHVFNACTSRRRLFRIFRLLLFVSRSNLALSLVARRGLRHGSHEDRAQSGLRDVCSQGCEIIARHHERRRKAMQ